jgi:sensor histidine kinase regulating citrate/malate metabolism
MKKLAYFSLRLRIAIFILVGTLVFSCIILYITYQYVNRTLTESLIEQGHLLAANIAEIAAEKIIEEDIVELKSIVEKYKYYSTIEYILIEDYSGQIKTDTYNGLVPSEISAGHSETQFGESMEYDVKMIRVTSQNTQVYDIKQAVKEGLLGYVRVGMKKSFVDGKIRETIGNCFFDWYFFSYHPDNFYYYITVQQTHSASHRDGS